jgi:hypothetical protein
MRLVKLEAAPWHIKMIDHKIIVVAKYLPIGNFTKPTDPGKQATRYPK